MYFLAIVGLLSTVVAAFYYLRIIKTIYFDEEKQKYVQEIIKADMQEAGQEDVFMKIKKDF